MAGLAEAGRYKPSSARNSLGSRLLMMPLIGGIRPRVPPAELVKKMLPCQVRLIGSIRWSTSFPLPRTRLLAMVQSSGGRVVVVVVPVRVAANPISIGLAQLTKVLNATVARLT